MENQISLENKKINYFTIFKTFLIEILTSFLFVLIFAVVMLLLEGGYQFSNLFATVSVAAGTLVAAFYLGKKLGNKGIFIGGSIGGITFIIITILSLILDNGAVGMNMLLRFIIIMLSGLIGGIIGVNKKTNQRYI